MSASFIDPAVLVWDIQDFNANSNKYESIAADIVALLSLLSQSRVQLVGSPELFSALINSFPYAGINTRRVGLSDFATLVYDFLSRRLSTQAAYERNNIAQSNPDIVNRAHYCSELKEEIAYSLSALASVDQRVIFSHVSLYHQQVASCTITLPQGIVASVPWGADLAAYQRYLIPPRKTYERYSKHAPSSGYGSRLPASLTDDDLQALLDVATGKTDKCLCAFSTAVRQYIVFRRHFSNAYHAYPIQENELSRNGINSSEIPRV